MALMNLAPWMFSWTVPLCRKDQKNTIRICNVGSSMGALSFDYAPFTDKGRNFAVAPQAIAYDLRLLEHFADTLARDAVVIYPLAPFSSCLYEYAGDEANWKYYPLLDGSVIPGFTEEKKTFIMDYLAQTPILPDPRLEQDFNSMKSPEELDADARKWMKIWHENFGISNFDAPFPENYRPVRKQSVCAFQQIRTLCRERGWKLLTVLTPVTPYLRRCFTETMLEEYVYSYVREIRAENFLDYLDDAEFRDPALYLDSFFLNRKGRIKFTRRVLEDINAL